MHKLEELKQIIYGYDELLSYWFEGVRPADASEQEEQCVYAMSDDYRNRALKILEEMKNALDKLI